MKRFWILSVMAVLCCPLSLGCDRKAEMKKETTVTTPGGETTTTTTRTVESSGDNPPAADGSKVPPK